MNFTLLAIPLGRIRNIGNIYVSTVQIQMLYEAENSNRKVHS